MIRVCVRHEDIDPAVELAALEATGSGGIASFTGLVRNDNGVEALTLDHYPAMTEAALISLAETAMTRWPLLATTIIHRIGRLALGERIVFVGTASAHRAAALESCAYLIDRLKTDAPFWKKEHRKSGDSWVEARDTDDQAASRWEEDIKAS